MGEQAVDQFQRPLIAEETKHKISEAFTSLPTDKRGALLVLVDEQGARAHLAAKVGNHWKVAAGAGKPWDGPVTFGVAIQGSW